VRRALLAGLSLLVLFAVLLVGTVIVHVVVIRMTAPETFEDYRAHLNNEIPSLMENIAFPVLRSPWCATATWLGLADMDRRIRAATLRSQMRPCSRRGRSPSRLPPGE
jgi:hypothetical protein